MRTNTRRSLGFALTLAGVVAVSVGLVGIVLRPTSADAPLFALLFAIPIVVSSAGAAIALRQSWWRQFTHLAMALFVTYAVGAGLILLTIAATANLMFLSDHDALLVLVIMIYATGVMLVFSYFVASSLSAGITDVTRAADAVRGGDLAARASESGRDEISRLARAFNEMTARLALAREQEDQLNHMRRDLIAWVSHDLRTPLTSLVGLADELTQRPGLGDEAVARSAGTIRDQALAMHHMLSNLLEMARLQGGEVRLNKEWQPVDDVIGSSLRLLGPALASRPVDVQILGDLPLVCFDAVLIERVVCNLLENALKYSPAGSPIRLTVRSADANLEIGIRNQGQGFPSDALKSVFKLFVRGSAEMAASGTGMGLAICQAIVAAHHGEIWAENSADGATVHFTLPLGVPPTLTEESVP